jgi:hypothetical protein
MVYEVSVCLTCSSYIEVTYGATANPISNRARNERTEECARREDGDDKGLLPGLVEDPVVRIIVVRRAWSCC